MRYWIALVFTLCLSTPSFAATCTHYVSPGGHSDTPSDSNAGTNITLPWATLGKMTSTAVAGNVVCMRGGTFARTTILNFPNSGTAANRITFQGYQAETAIVSYPGWSSGWNSNYSTTQNFVAYITFENFTMSGATFAFHMFGANNIIWSRVTILNSGSGILGHCWRCTIDRSTLYHNGWGGGTPSSTDHNLYIYGNEWVVTNNLLYDAGGSNITFSCGDHNVTLPSTLYSGCANSIIANNTIAYSANGPAIFLWAGESSLQAYNNVISENNIFLQNNTVGVDTGGIYLRSMPSDTGLLVRNNLFWDTTGVTTNICVNNPLLNCSNSTFGGYWTSTNNLFGVNPLLVNAPTTKPTTPDFNFTASSPIAPSGPVNFGLNLTGTITTTLDYGGVQRPVGGAWDLGAYEFGTTPDTTPPAAPTGLRITRLLGGR